MNQHLALSSKDSPAGLLLRLPLCDKSISSELVHEFTLPDYLPEIRKMLRVTATVLPAESYVGTSNAEFSGAMKYHVLYVGADGQLWAETLPAEYTFSVPIETPDSCDFSMGVDAFADSTPEMLVTRVLSPRKISIRCRMRSTARVYGWHSLEEKLSGSPRGKIERLTGEAVSCTVLRGRLDGVELSDELLPDHSAGTPDSLRVVTGEGHVFVSEAIPENDRVNLRGELILKLLTVRDASPDENAGAPTPSVTIRKLPFSAAVTLEGADRYCDCRGFGCLTNLIFTTEEGRILCDAELSLTAECQKNTKLAFTRDVFSTGAECEASYGSRTLPFALRASNGNFTLSDTVALDKANVTASDRILDVTGDLAVDSVTPSAGRTLYVGAGHFHLLTQNAESGEYGFSEISVPFRYTADGEKDGLPALKAYDASFEPISIRVKSDGEKLSIDAEIAVSSRTEGEQEIKLLSSARFGEPFPKTQGKIVLYYPSQTDTLWDAARKYHITTSDLAAMNGMDPIPDTSLSSTRYLVVNE